MLSRTRIGLVFFALILSLAAQEATEDSTSYLTQDVMRVGDRLACRCGGCRNTVGNCPMIRCSSADPKRKRIFQLKRSGLSDDAVVNSFVQSEGVVALSAPPANSVGGFISWVMPGIALLFGLFIYMRFVRKNQAHPVTISEQERANMERFRTQLEGESEPATKQ